MSDPDAAPGRPGDRSQRIVLLLILLGFYCFPQVLISIMAASYVATSTGHKIDSDSALYTIIIELSTNAGLYTNSIHQMILPVAAAITAVTVKDCEIAGGYRWLFLLPLITIFACIVAALLFNVASTFEVPQKGSISQYFVSIASNLSVYVMLLVGLQAKVSS